MSTPDPTKEWVYTGRYVPVEDWPAEGWLSVNPSTNYGAWDPIPCVSVVEHERRMADAVAQERQRCLAAVEPAIRHLMRDHRDRWNDPDTVRDAVTARIESGEQS